MSDARVRTSLNWTPSGETSEQQRLRIAQAERDLWHQLGAILVRRTDPGMETLVDAIGQTRFGKREQRA